MRVLGLETAGEQGCVGLVDGDRPLCDLVFEATMAHGEKLLPAVEAALALAGLSKRDLDLIAVSRGPGSFTGLRIGLATAQGLARALGIPLVGVSGFEVYCRKAAHWPGPVWVLLPDRRDWLYASAFHRGREILAPRVLARDELLARLRAGGATEEPAEGKALLIGPGVEAHREALRAAPGGQHDPVPRSLNLPSGVEIARLGREGFARRGRDERYELEPLYVQEPPVRTSTRSPIPGRRRAVSPAPA